MTRFKRGIVAASVLIFIAGWGRIGWQALTRVSPPRGATYVTGNGGVWTDPGFPHCTNPCLIDGGKVWKFCKYGKDRDGTRSGFIRFDLERGAAEMRWMLPGKSRHGRVIGAVKHEDGRVAVAWQPNMGKVRVDILRPKGGVVPAAVMTHGGGYSEVRGMAWVRGDIEIAVGATERRGTTILRIESKDRWRSRHVAWPAHEFGLPVLAMAMYDKGRWTSLVADWPRTPDRDRKPRSVKIFLFAEGTSSLKVAGSILVKPIAARAWLDGAPGNIFTRTIGFQAMYQLDGHRLRKMVPGPLGKRRKFMIPDNFYRYYVLKPNRMERVVRWKHRRSHDQLLQYPGREFLVSSRASDAARRARRAIFVESGNRTSAQPVVEDFRFRTGALFAPARGGGWWILGTFGTHVQVGRDLARADAPNLWERFVRLDADFSSRKAQYDDFLLQAAPIKRLILPAVLLGLPALWLLLGGGQILLRRGGSRPGSVGSRLVAGSLVYVVLSAAAGYWFWMISVNF